MDIKKKIQKMENWRQSSAEFHPDRGWASRTRPGTTQTRAAGTRVSRMLQKLSLEQCQEH